MSAVIIDPFSVKPGADSGSTLQNRSDSPSDQFFRSTVMHASNTCETGIASMHAFPHSSAGTDVDGWQGKHASCGAATTVTLSPMGRHTAGSDGPNSTTLGAPAAAARWEIPESLPT